MELDSKIIYRIKDTFHKHINGDEEPWVYSNHPAFFSNNSFLEWVKQHTSDLSLIEEYTSKELL